ncbi:TetR/AcrR family transcriptional regulator [Actinophytocola algeriensis]|uniref:AcrR family transcriptional regulator n=1 Tax=Actinophytocola algeriensis TaxID=1768010 RepID=A0A7W7PZX0_9PSEU|nr:TetR/AcrR family transcriptional regulator [Actinophytocola algeriensis]MBB4904415.1 AcrR family transcriptional regulator [Actinophytocola algeriensis]MBE1476727.1 AcrR family transcriptional regulator [Actinophytocola algeriensis]
MTETKTRRRGERLEQAILDATWAELAEVGYTALTIEAVAKRAGTSKPVIYRRWQSRAHLVVSAWVRQQPQESGTPDLGSLRADLVWLFTRVADRMAGMMSETIAGVMADAFKHPEVQTLLRDRLDSAPLTGVIRHVVDNAVARGELRPVELPRMVLRLPLDLVRAVAVFYGPPVPDEMVESMVDDVYLPLLKGLALD